MFKEVWSNSNPDKHTSMKIILKCPHCGSEIDDLDETQNDDSGVHPEHEPEEEEEASSTGSKVAKALMIGGAVVAAPCLAMSAMGFGAAGIVGGSVAAGIQSSIGSVAAGSTFAAMQSLGATGTFVYGATAGGATSAAGFLFGRKNNNTEDDTKHDGNKGDNGTKGEKNTAANEKPSWVHKCKKCGGTVHISL